MKCSSCGNQVFRGSVTVTVYGALSAYTGNFCYACAIKLLTKRSYDALAQACTRRGWLQPRLPEFDNKIVPIRRNVDA
jgi:DNA-directed RNA polymerase subunit RPC12/RpoP